MSRELGGHSVVILLSLRLPVKREFKFVSSQFSFLFLFLLQGKGLISAAFMVSAASLCDWGYFFKTILLVIGHIQVLGSKLSGQ